MSVLFFCRDAPQGTSLPPLPSGMTMRVWAPARDGFPPSPLWRHNVLWWLMDRARLFAQRDFAEITLWQGDDLLHRLILTPRWYRFPFMAGQDLQIGNVWTHPAMRGQGLARLGVGQALAVAQGRVWYVTGAQHRASIALATGMGFRPAGHGYRSRPFALHAAGRFIRVSPPPPR
jgi:RimJ/RimL family protein N-acetyltransferase